MKIVIAKLSILVAALLLSPISIYGQAKSDAKRIMSSFEYVYGEGWGETEEIADKQALANLVSKITTTISNQFTVDESEMSDGNNVSSETKVNSIVNTYSQATLNNVGSIVIEQAPKAHVLRFIKISELNKAFEQRKEKVFDYLRSAARSEANGRIDNALRYYYWSMIMLKSLQYPNEIKFEDEEGSHLLTSWIPMKINGILENIDAQIARRSGDVVDLYVTYKGNPVGSLDFTYFDGLQWSQLNNARNGIASIELRKNSSIRNLQVKYEYQYADETRIDKETEQVMSLFKEMTFPKASRVIGGNAKKETADFKTDYSKQLDQLVKTESILTMPQVDNAKDYAKIMEKIIGAIQSRKYDDIRGLFTDDGWDMFDKLMHYGNARLVGEANFGFYPMEDNVVCRSIPMSFSFNNNKKKFIESVTFTFDKQMKVEAIAFALDSKAIADIFHNRLSKWSDNMRLIVASFLENYKTAFALKRLDYIENLFADDAVIIVGHVLKKKPRTVENEKYLNNKEVVYNRLSKADYINNLRKSFGSNEYINIRFTDNEVTKSQAGGELYGIQIHQDYCSSSYGDTGYLFLLVDINNPKQPTIFVRTWQPQRDPRLHADYGKDDPEYGIYGIGDF